MIPGFRIKACPEPAEWVRNDRTEGNDHFGSSYFGLD
jgi:hypothetical protein